MIMCKRKRCFHTYLSISNGTRNLERKIWSISKWFSVRMTKEIFAGFFKKAIPVVGGMIGGGLTYATFKPCCTKLKNVLEDTYLSNPDYDKKEDIIIDVEDADVEKYGRLPLHVEQ